MALTKDRTLVWISDTSRNRRRTITWIACPYGNKKDLETRLKSMASKKVKGSRLESLSYDLLDESTIPFVKEFLTGVFRISDLACAQASIFEKAGLAEQAGMDHLAAMLKEMFPDCSFEIIFDSRHLRKSLLSRWMKKNQIPGSAAEASLQENRMLQTATLLSMIDCGNAEGTESLKEMLLRQFDMAKNWSRLDGKQIYLAQLEEQDQKPAEHLFARVPALLETGRFDAWLKKQPAAGFMEKAETLFESGMPEESLIALNPKKISESFDLLSEQLARAQQPLDMNALESWLDASIESIAKLNEELNLGIDLSQWKAILKTMLDEWLENPLSFSCKDRPAVYVLGKDNQTILISTQYPRWIESDLPAESRQMLYEVYACEPGSLLASLCALSPQAVYASSSMIKKLHRQSVLENRYLPLYVMSPEQAERISSLDLDEPAAAPHGNTEHEREWFSEMIFDYLDEEQKQFLAQNILSLSQARQLARSFARGLTLEKAQKQCTNTNRLSKTVYELCAPYLFLGKQKRFLDNLSEDWQYDLLAKDSYSLSQMIAISRLLEKGMDPDWIACSLKGKTTVRQIQALASSYPFGKIPRKWNRMVPMDEKLADWLVFQALSAHPQLRQNDIARSLRSFNQSVMERLFERPLDWRLTEE